MNPDLFWIAGPWRGRLAISTRPRGGDWLEDDVRGWRRAGIDVVVSLLESDEASQLRLLDESKAADANGISFIHFRSRIVACRLPCLRLSHSLATVSSALGEGRNVAVHCRQGIGRSGLIAAGILGMRACIPNRPSKSSATPAGSPFLRQRNSVSGCSDCSPSRRYHPLSATATACVAVCAWSPPA